MSENKMLTVLFNMDHWWRGGSSNFTQEANDELAKAADPPLQTESALRAHKLALAFGTGPIALSLVARLGPIFKKYWINLLGNFRDYLLASDEYVKVRTLQAKQNLAFASFLLPDCEDQGLPAAKRPPTIPSDLVGMITETVAELPEDASNMRSMGEIISRQRQEAACRGGGRRQRRSLGGCGCFARYGS